MQTRREGPCSSPAPLAAWGPRHCPSSPPRRAPGSPSSTSIWRGAEAVVAGIKERGGDAVAISADVGDLESINAMVEATLEAFGCIDILVNNAGITRYAPFMEVTEDDWDSFMRVNAKGSFFTLQRVAAEMIQRGEGGRIINMASIAGKGFRGTSNAAYASTKGAVIAFTYQASSALAQHNICVNAVCPGAHRHRHVARRRPAACGGHGQVLRGAGKLGAGEHPSGPHDPAGRRGPDGGVPDGSGRL